MTHRTLRLLLCAAVLAAVAATNDGCATLADLAGTMSNLQRLKFKVAGVSGFTVAEIGITQKQRLSDFSLLDGIRLLAAYQGEKLPASFTLNVEAVNPNDGTGGAPQTASTLTSFAWRLLIDGKQTVAGDISRPIEIPGTGQASVIPLKIELDLVAFFKDKGYEDLLNLALALGGMKSDITRLALDAQPRVTTPLGEIAYPGRITVVSKEYR